MPFLDRLSSLAQNAMDSTKGLVEINRLNSGINAEKVKIAELKAKIGEYYWAQHASGVTLDDEPAGYCSEIKDREDKIASIEAKIRAKNEEAQKAAQAAQPPQAAQTAPGQQPGTVACPVCGAANPAASKFCGECGGKLEAPPADKPLICAACGAGNPPGTKFCGSCGNKLEIPAT